MSEERQSNSAQSPQDSRPRLFNEGPPQVIPETPLDAKPAKDTEVASRIALSTNVPVYNQGWGEVQPERTGRRPLSKRRIKRELRKFWYQRGAWQIVAILFLAVATVLIVNWLSRPAQPPPLPGTPVRR
jgi:hypothetical protein